MLPDEGVYVRDIKPNQLIGWVTERIGLYDLAQAFSVTDITRNEPEPPRLTPTWRIDLQNPITGEHRRVRAAEPSTRARLLTEHYPICNRCGQLWPCRDELIEAAARQAAMELDARCVVCGDRFGARMAEIRTETPDGVAVRRYHTRKGSVCRRAYLKAVANDPIALAELRREDAGWSRS